MDSITLDGKLQMSPLRPELAASTNPTPSEAGSSNQAFTVHEEGSEMCAAAASGNINCLREILELGAISVDQGDYDSRTALHLAASEGLLDTVQFLVEGSWSAERLPHGANLSPIDRWGGTPLDDAVRGEQRAVANYLRSRGAQSGSGHGSKGDAVMLCVAAARGDVQCLREQLLSRGISPDISDHDKRTPVHLAASEGQMAVLRFLVEEVHCNVNPIDGRQHTPLDDATREHRTEAAAYLREMGGKMQRTKPSDGRFSREFAKVAKHASPRRLMQRKVRTAEDAPVGTSTPPSSRRGSTLLGSIKRRGSLDQLVGELAFEVTTKRNRVRRVTTTWRLTAESYAVRRLCAAAANGDTEALRELVSEGTDVNSGDYDHRTPLHLAASEGLLPVVVFLLEDAGAEHSPLDRWGGTPLDDVARAMQAADDVLQESRWHDVAAYLRSRGATKGLASKDEASLLCAAAEDGWVLGLQQLILSQGLSPDLCSYDGRTAMHCAAAGKHLGALRFLVQEAHAAVNPTDRWGETPLDEAVKQGDTPLVTYLWTHGANLGRPASGGKSLELIAGAMVFKSRLGEVVLIDAAHELRVKREKGPHQVSRKGWLYKLARGGRVTWQRRYFALAGSTLFFADDPDVIQAEPRLFAECGSVRVMQSPGPLKGHEFAFAMVQTSAESLASVSGGGGGDGPGGEGGNPFELGLLRAESDVERDAWTAAIMENAHQPSCPGNLLASLLTYQFHQDQQDGITTVFRWEGVRDVGRETSLMGATRTQRQAIEGGGADPYREVSVGQRWAESCLQWLGRDVTPEPLAAMGESSFGANDGLAPLERAIASCLRGMRNIV